MQDKLLYTFNTFEKENSLFEIEIDGIFIWDYLRVDVFNSIQTINDKLNYTKKSLKQAPFKSVILVLKQIFFILFNFGRMKFKEEKDILVIGHPRRQKRKNVYIDIYTDIILKEIRKQYSFVSLELPFNLSHFKPVDCEELRYLDILELGQSFSPFFRKYELKKKDIILIDNIEYKIKKEFGCSVNLNDKIAKAISKYRYSYSKINRIVNSINPKIIIVVDGYNFIKKIFIEVASEKKIPTIELQHGIIGDGHISYNFPENIKPTSFPDYFFSWGQYWHHTTRFPENTKVFNSGFPLMEYEKNYNVLSYSSKYEKNILVSSQWKIGFELLSFINKIALKMPNYSFKFKLHPLEYNSLNQYKNKANAPNIQFLVSDKSIYTLFKECRFHIGAYSTTLVEGLAFNLKTFIVPLKGYLRYSELIDKGYFTVLEDFNNIEYKFNQSKVKIDNSYIWEDNALIKSIKQLEEIIANGA